MILKLTMDLIVVFFSQEFLKNKLKIYEFNNYLLQGEQTSQSSHWQGHLHPQPSHLLSSSSKCRDFEIKLILEIEYITIVFINLILVQ